MSSRADTAGVIAPPPLIMAAALLGGWLLGLVLPVPSLPRPLAGWIGSGAILLAFALAGAAVLTMRRAGTHVDPYHPSTALVRSGPFAVSRNPIYLALILLSLGIAVLLDLAWGVLLLIPAVLVLRFGVIAREEAYLERIFGDAYRDYRSAVRRWI
ncbi:Isoprenylcysteine carboxylmethyltransferase family protein [Rhodovastum atsumiense]|uniref:Isoprenylcysteine carboxylmethyltransferase family protein n=1 Tax=Rhodovastum atsumiense TaxID=504468 RepID=A0A5M6J2A2_9PROT|nr:isoprenylcysteine carboxylmethyltransferase family protein [Rhodovastum atsumiense]KAA5614730.1 isoprenylcysteine carboxylmethyltransferase family protein [Rhodovastum atsumiense]CAH2599731.1 Isoprenylcysteine carboxylmethyltransferase family protein [Rhodovastum atsumiense]